MIFTVQPDEAGQRLDQFLVGRLPDRSRSEVQRWVKEGRVALLEGAESGPPSKAGASPLIPLRTSLRMAAGMAIQVDLPDAPAPVAELTAEAIALSIVYEDDDLLVIDKPAGMVVHPAPGHETGTLVNAVLHHVPTLEGVGGERRPGIVHRLDRETSGLIVVAKHDRAMRDLQAQFKARTVFKEYLCLVEGGMDPPAGIIDAPMGRHPTDRKRQTILPEDARSGTSLGRDAVTEYHTLERYSAPASMVLGGAGRMTFSLLRVVLHTGRTHQIRVHFAWRQHPVVGDTLYGPRSPRLPLKRQFLHAHRLGLRLPTSGEERIFVSPLPADLQSLLDRLADAA
jgi:23S rRNA pseudouridine1911/1915/1917 synthase